MRTATQMEHSHVDSGGSGVIMSGRYLLAVMVATFATAIFLIVRNKATEQETLDMLLDDEFWP
jgi:hypothetical protein